MAAPPVPDRPTFVPIAETLRLRGEATWRGEIWPRADLGLLLLVTAIGCLLRLWRLEVWSLSPAEAELWRGATEPLSGATGFFATERSLHPLPALLVRGLLGGFLPGTGEGWLRLPFAFVGMLTVPLLALVGDRLVGRRPALFAALLLAVLPWHLRMSQTASGVVLAVFAGVLAVGCATVAAQLGSRRWFGFAVLVGLGGAAAHPAGVLTLCGGAALGLLRWAPAAPRWPVAALLLVGALAPWLLPRSAAAPWHLDEFVGTWRGTLLLASSVQVCLAWRAVGGGRLLAATGGALGAAAYYAVVSGHAFDELAAAALPAGLLAAARVVHDAATAVRERLPAAPSLASRLVPLAVPAALLLDAAVASFLYATVDQGLRPDWRAARDVVLATAAPAAAGPPVVVAVGEGFDPLAYYLRPNHWRRLGVDPHSGFRLVAWPTPGDGAPTPLPGSATHVVLSQAEYDRLAADRGAAAAFAAAQRLVAVLPFRADGHRSLLVFQARPAAPR